MNGEVTFENVDKDKYTLKVTYQSYAAEQKLIVDGKTKEVDVTLNV